MATHSDTHAVLAGIDLVQGLAPEAVRERLHLGKRLNEAGFRVLAFYLTEMEERQLYRLTGHGSTAHFAEAVLGLDRRRFGELLSVGKKLLELPLVDAAFCEDQLSWSKVVELVKVATPTHEEKWIEVARKLGCKALADEVRRARPGGPPRDPNDRRGLPAVRYPLHARVDQDTHDKFESVRTRLSAKRGRAVPSEEVVAEALDCWLDAYGANEEEEPTAEPPEEEALVEDGSVDELDPNTSKKTSKALRDQVLALDGHACCNCDRTHDLHVHHIVYRSRGGKTVIWNLITLCKWCHAHVHEGLLILEGDRAGEIRFVDRTGHPLDEDQGDAKPSDRVPIALPRLRAEPDPEAKIPDPPKPQPRPAKEVFADLRGLDRLVALLDTTAQASAKRERPFPHTLFTGPPGTGKTTLAQAIADLIGARLHAVTGATLETIDALTRVLTELREGDVLFLDEAHAVPRPVLEVLYEAMTRDLTPFTVVAATTEEAELPRPFRDRFGLQESLGFYAQKDLVAIATAVAEKRGYELPSLGGYRLARSARETPRLVLRLLERVLDVAAIRDQTVLDPGLVWDTLEELGYDFDGLDQEEQRYLAALEESGGPLPLASLAALLGKTEQRIRRELEPRLVRGGWIRITPRGRELAVTWSTWAREA